MTIVQPKHPMVALALLGLWAFAGEVHPKSAAAAAAAATSRTRVTASSASAGAVYRSIAPAPAEMVLAGVVPATPAAAAPIRLTLPQAIATARAQSPSALAAIHRYRASHWQHVTFKADYRPSLDLDTAPVAWDRTIAQQTLPNGTDAFVPRSQANSTATLSLSKVIVATGGRISLRSEIARTNALEGFNGLQYFSTPVAVSLSQPLFAFNSYAWGAQIEPRRYAEARQQLVEEMEGISATATDYFFDLQSAQTALRDTEDEKAQADTLFAVTRRRFEQGRAPESDVLQAELASLNADLRLTRARLDLAVRGQRLATYLGLVEMPAMELVATTDGPVVHLDLDTAIREARKNRPQAMSFDRQLLEAERSVAEARSSRGTTWLTASYGLSRSTDRLARLYQDPTVDQRAQISIHTPLLDWGRSRARLAVAESEREVTRRQVQQARADFDRDVFLRVSQFNLQAQQLRLSAHADSVAQRRHQLTRRRYLTSGQGDFDAINVAQMEKENARRAWLDAMRTYWTSYYDVRRATLYDFERAEPLSVPGVEF
jgi:outer membrane protein TolC